MILVRHDTQSRTSSASCFDSLCLLLSPHHGDWSKGVAVCLCGYQQDKVKVKALRHRLSKGRVDVGRGLGFSDEKWGDYERCYQ